MVETDGEISQEKHHNPTRLDVFRTTIEAELIRAKEMVRQRMAGLKILDFDIRGKLYALALELSPNAREQEAGTLMKMIDLKEHEDCVDIAAGTGLLTGKIAGQSKGNVYAIDPSREQLQILEQNFPTVHTIQGSPDDVDLSTSIRPESVDVVTSQGGIHHVPNQRIMFENIATMLRPNGRCICADVCDGTDLAHHFDEYVAAKCLTGHDSNWLSERKIEELIKGLPLELIHIERRPISWVFESEAEIALFFKGLHAYDLPESDVITDLRQALGIFQKDGKYHVNWPLLFFHLQKK